MDTKKIKRRGFIAMMVATFTYVLYLVAENNRWIILTHRARHYEPGQLPSSKSPHREISLLLIGDTGLPSDQRVNVVNALVKQAFVAHLDGALLLGDNFYEQGVTSVEDRRFDDDFEQVFVPEQFDCPFYPALGNHDYAGNVDAQVEYSQRSSRWEMPDLYYKVRHEADGQTLDLFVIDSNVILRNKLEAKEHLKWLEQELSDSDATWKIVAGHHPCLSGGEHGPSEMLFDVLSPLFVRHKVALYIAGHEHDLQVLDSQQGWLQAISGSGSKIRSTTWIDSTEFAAAKPGFAWLLVQENHLSISFFSCDGHLCTRELSPQFAGVESVPSLQSA